MVKGIEKFREAFSVFSENYVIIGGTACDAVLSKTMVEPRATVDIDMILVVEKMTAEFANAFWQFVKEGQYRNGKRKRGEGKAPAYELYRFEDGKPGFPAKVELLSRHSDLLGEPSGFHLEPIPTGEDVSSLSAIMMDEEYYELTVNNSYVEDGLRYASHAKSFDAHSRTHSPTGWTGIGCCLSWYRCWCANVRISTSQCRCRRSIPLTIICQSLIQFLFLPSDHRLPSTKGQGRDGPQNQPLSL